MIDAEKVTAALKKIAGRYRSNSLERSYLTGVALRPHLVNAIVEELNR